MHRTFTFNDFQKHLYKIKEIDSNKIFWNQFENVTENGIKTKEIVFLLKTKIPYIKIKIYSSIDEETKKSRENGTERVKICAVRNYKGKDYFHKIARHNREENLESYMVNSIKKYYQNIEDVFKVKWVDDEKDIWGK